MMGYEGNTPPHKGKRVRRPAAARNGKCEFDENVPEPLMPHASLVAWWAGRLGCLNVYIHHFLESFASLV